MNFKVDNSILWDNVFFIETDSGVKYVAKLEETSPGSGVWTLFFLLLNGIPNSREIFGTMNTLTLKISVSFCLPCTAGSYCATVGLSTA